MNDEVSNKQEQTVPCEAVLTKNDLNLVWLDLEMTGLNPDHNRIIELAVIVTNADLSVSVQGPVLVIHQSDALLNSMDTWNKSTHGKSGLIDRVKVSTVTEEEAEKEVLTFIKRYVSANMSPLCGNSIGQDRRFLVKYMPKLEAYLHYRNIDVSTLKELARRWKPEVHSNFKKKQAHTALADVQESIDELKYYRNTFLNC